MGEGATGQAVMPQMLTAAQKEKYLAAWALEELAALRRDMGDTREFGVTAAELVFRAWRPDGTGERLAADDPRQLRGLIAASKEHLARSDDRGRTTRLRQQGHDQGLRAAAPVARLGHPMGAVYDTYSDEFARRAARWLAVNRPGHQP